MGRRAPTAILLTVTALGGCALLVDTSDLTGGTSALAGDGGEGTPETSTPGDGASALAADAGGPTVLLTAGGDHSCAAIDGSAFCWGRNTSGEIGDGTKTSAPLPVRVNGLPGTVTSIAAGDSHTCAIVASEVWCWGSAGMGALGPGANVDSVVPVKVELPAPALHVDAGELFTCALAGNSRIYCWGKNDHGRLGDGTTVSHKTPSAVVDATGIRSDFAQLSADADHACAITRTGDPFCWGHNDNGALGDPTAGDQSSHAVPVGGLPGKAESISIGGWHACARVGGGAFCWGTGAAGELGNGGTSHSTAPVPVIGHGSNVSLLHASGGPDDGDSTCAARDGTVSCWGNGHFGRLGDGTTTSRGTPAPVSALPAPATALAGGQNHWCAALTTGDVMCWGRGASGQLGDGASVDRLAPVRAKLDL